MRFSPPQGRREIPDERVRTLSTTNLTMDWHFLIVMLIVILIVICCIHQILIRTMFFKYFSDMDTE